MERTAAEHNHSPLLGRVLCTATRAGHGEKKEVVLFPLLICHLNHVDLKVSSVPVMFDLSSASRSSFGLLQSPRREREHLRPSVFATFLPQGYTRVGQTGVHSPTELRTSVWGSLGLHRVYAHHPPAVWAPERFLRAASWELCCHGWSQGMQHSSGQRNNGEKSPVDEALERISFDSSLAF